METIQTDIMQKLEKEVQNVHYKAQRYSEAFTFALLNYSGELSQDILHNFLRKSDYCLQLKEGYYFISFYHTDEENALKASENLLFKLDKYLQNQNSFIAIDRIDNYESTLSTLNRLMQILQEIKKRNYTRVGNEAILNELF